MTPPKSNKKPTKKNTSASDTSWGKVATWYDTHLEKDNDTYHEKVIYPNLLRLLGNIQGKKILDLACGQGQFSSSLARLGGDVVGVDIGKELIVIAEEHKKKAKMMEGKLEYFVSQSDDLYMCKDNSFDNVICILALQNIEKLQETIQEVTRVMAKNGSCYFVLNHPSFRNPKKTHWGYDEHNNIEYRRIDSYLSERSIQIDMTPGSKKDKKFTVSFHRPLQVYMKAFRKEKLAIVSMEEWISHKVSEQGPRKKAEDVARKEIPLFLFLELRKLSE